MVGPCGDFPEGRVPVVALGGNDVYRCRGTGHGLHHHEVFMRIDIVTSTSLAGVVVSALTSRVFAFIGRKRASGFLNLVCHAFMAGAAISIILLFLE